ncbi:MAG TPA: RNA polymerase sigma factor [Kofleriaceae bacterium]|nr:RNA polymerase sigma factor [Kofleriaceae bacterium]
MAAESDLMARYCDGDASAFRELHARIAPRLVAYLARMCGDRATAEDLVQQTFLKVHRARSAYVRGADPVPWMFAIAHRTFLDEARRKQRSRVQVAREEGGVPEVPAEIDGTPADRRRDGPDPAMVRAALAALEELPPSQREALILTKLSGKSVAEAAVITGSTPGAVKLRAHRGYVALRKALSALGLGGAP